MSNLRLVIASGNKAKIKEIKKFASKYRVTIIDPADIGIPNIEVNESGNTFHQNAELKLRAYLKYVSDRDVWVIADDSGIEIPSLNNEPGVHTRRWAGHVMTDREILDYCLKRMKGMKDNNRRATFKTVLATAKLGTSVNFYTGEMRGEILEKPRSSIKAVIGFPFRSVFYVTGAKKMIYELQDYKFDNKKRFKTHREIAFDNLFKSISKK